MVKILQLYYAAKHLITRRIFMGMRLPKEAIVLDIGSGDKPFWRADVFVDDLSVSDSERAGHVAPHKFGIFVDANAESLPFEDQTFDFVYCSHLLTEGSTFKVCYGLSKTNITKYLAICRMHRAISATNISLRNAVNC